MNKKTVFGIILSTLCILILVGLGVYLMIDLKNITSAPSSSPSISSLSTEMSPETEEITEPESEKAAGIDKQTAAALAAIEAARASLPEHQFIFIGDSRTVGMEEAEADTGDSCLYIGAVGEGYYWFTETGIFQMEAAMKEYPEAPLILNLGVNDLDMIDAYVELYHSFTDKYPKHFFYFMSVNPVTEKSEHVTNMEISAFNSRLREEFPQQYLDSNTYLMIQEFESADGVHYSGDTYRMIHDYVVRQLVQQKEITAK